MARAFKILALVASFCVAAVVGGLLVILDDSREISETNEQTKQNGEILNVIAAVTGCTIADTQESCQAKLRAETQRRNLVERVGRVVEVDCVHRRAHAGLPAPDPSKSCPEQTPKEIYPGNP